MPITPELKDEIATFKQQLPDDIALIVIDKSHINLWRLKYAILCALRSQPSNEMIEHIAQLEIY